MKTKKIIYSLFLALSLTFTACTLDFAPNSVISKDGLTADNFPLLTAPLYNLYWYNFNGQFYYGLGDGMAHNLMAPYSNYIYPFDYLTVTPLTGPLVNAWNSLYAVVQQSNKVINDIQAASSVPDDQKTPYIAEARFMRGLAYWHLTSLWGNVILSTDPSVLVQNPIVNTNTQDDGFQFAIRDMEYAAKYLPETPSATGRVSKYSAFGMLSRFYLAYSGFLASGSGQNPNCGTRDQSYLDLAKQAAEKVIDSGKYRLMDNYPDLFKIENNNNSESLFAFQWVPKLYNSADGKVYSNVINTQQAYFAFSSLVTGDDAAWGGGGTGCPYDMILEYDANDTIRRKATWMGCGDFYPEINTANGGLIYNKTTFSSAETWISVKKGVVGSPKDTNGASARMNSALDNYMQRLAEVYLNYAEAILGNNTSTSDANALYYFNEVRRRAGMPAKSSITWEDIRHERRIEFCMEGRYWYDLLSRAYYHQQEVINYIVGQNRATNIHYLFDAPNNLRIDPATANSSLPAAAPTPSSFLLPYPQSEVSNNPKLAEPPVSYTFTEERITDLFN